jgi:hypothetical protein
MKSHTHIGFWVMLTLVSLFIAPMFIGAQRMQSQLEREIAGMRQVFGVGISNVIVRGANSAHAVFSEFGGDDAILGQVHTQKQREDAKKYMSVTGELLADTADAYFNSLAIQAYSMALRLLAVAAWLILLSPFIVAAVVDGVSARNAKLSEFGYQNPTAFAIAIHTVILLSGLPLLYVTLPFAITPMFMPWWALLSALPAAFAISHAQPILTR